MRNFRKKDWFRLTSNIVNIDEERFHRIGEENVKKIVRIARKHKTSIFIDRQPKAENQANPFFSIF